MINIVNIIQGISYRVVGLSIVFGLLFFLLSFNIMLFMMIVSFGLGVLTSAICGLIKFIVDEYSW